MAARSFTLPPGFKYSSLAKMSAAPDGTTRLSCKRGVLPTSFVMSSATRSREASVRVRTLQGTEGWAARSIALRVTGEFARNVGTSNPQNCLQALIHIVLRRGPVGNADAHGSMSLPLRSAKPCGAVFL